MVLLDKSKLDHLLVSGKSSMEAQGLCDTNRRADGENGLSFFVLVGQLDSLDSQSVM